MGEDLNLVDKFKRGSISVLVGTIALSCAISIIESIWPTLAIIVGVLTLLVGAVMIYRKMRGGW
ncbi:hypothetical protein ACWEKT_34685 [Nocardia takedensis]